MTAASATREFIQRAFEEFLDALYPSLCALCGGRANGGFACEAHRLPREPCGTRCPICASPIAHALANAGRCAACRIESPGFAQLVALGDYRAQPALAEWILPFKHGGRRELAEPLGHALAERWRASGVAVEEALLVPVPLHFARRIERGFDQARSLAREIAASSGARWCPALARSRATAVQGSPGAVSRAANVDGAFRPSRWTVAASERVAAASCVWIVDDVVTSGATVRECARVLRRMGAREVRVLALARAGASLDTS